MLKIDSLHAFRSVWTIIPFLLTAENLVNKIFVLFANISAKGYFSRHFVNKKALLRLCRLHFEYACVDPMADLSSEVLDSIDRKAPLYFHLLLLYHSWLFKSYFCRRAGYCVVQYQFFLMPQRLQKLSPVCILGCSKNIHSKYLSFGFFPGTKQELINL